MAVTSTASFLLLFVLSIAGIALVASDREDQTLYHRFRGSFFFFNDQNR
jgi:hypothetical protein